LEPDVAKIVFVRDYEIGNSSLARIVDEAGHLVVISAPGTNFTVKLPPGEHAFYSCAGGDTDALKATLRAGAVYGVVVKRNGWNVDKNYLLAARSALPDWFGETKPLGALLPGLPDKVADAACSERGAQIMQAYRGAELEERLLHEGDAVAPRQAVAAIAVATPQAPTPPPPSEAPKTEAGVCTERCDAAGDRCAARCTNDLLATHGPVTDAYYQCQEACSSRNDECDAQCRRSGVANQANAVNQAAPGNQAGQENQADQAPSGGQEGAGAGTSAPGGGSASVGAAPGTSSAPGGKNVCGERYVSDAMGNCVLRNQCDPGWHVCPPQAHSARVCCPNK
jgi:hypothetical protein